jgi:predicted ATPase
LGQRWIALGQWPEPAYRALMSAYAGSGDLSKAVATYERFAQGLRKDLGVEPSEQTQALFKRIKAGGKPDKPQLPRFTPEAVSPFLALPSLPRSNLPKPMTSFIGREKEIQQVKQLVSKARLVAITGPGGVGKTRLAIQVAGALALQFRDGVWWVELAAVFETVTSRKGVSSYNSDSSHLRDSQNSPVGLSELTAVDLVAQAVGKALRVPESPGGRIVERVIEHLRERQLLLVLDNCEQFIAACATFAERTLQDCPGITILATSREALGVPGEKAWLLPPLSLPEIGPALAFDHFIQSEAVSLFVERSGDVLPSYQPGEAEITTIAQICRRLDGIPLAIELAAARMKLLSATEIAGWLDHRFNLLTTGRRTSLPRHQTLWAAIEWSYDLLNQIIRSFGRLKLDEAGETVHLCDHCAEYYLRLVEAGEPELLGPKQKTWLTRLKEEHNNLRTVLQWSLDTHNVEMALKLVGSLWRYWWMHSHHNEGRQWLGKVLSMTGPQSLPWRAKALLGAGILARGQGDYNQASTFLNECLEIQRNLQDKNGIANALNSLGLLAHLQGDYSKATINYQESLKYRREIGDTRGIAALLHNLSMIYQEKGEFAQAEKLLNESLSLFLEISDARSIAATQLRFGYLRYELKDVVQAEDFFRKSLVALKDLGGRNDIIECLEGFAGVAALLMQPRRGARLLAAAQALRDIIDIPVARYHRALYQHIVESVANQLDSKAIELFSTEGRAMSLEEAIEYALRGTE